MNTLLKQCLASALLLGGLFSLQSASRAPAQQPEGQDGGESVNDMLKGKPAPAWASELRKDSAGYLTLSTDAIIHQFAQDLPPAQARLVAATQGPWFAGCTDDKVTNAAWHSKPSWFVVTGKDHMIDPRAQDAMAANIGATVKHLDASHVAMLSQPRAVADAIIEAASKVQ